VITITDLLVELSDLVSVLHERRVHSIATVNDQFAVHGAGLRRWSTIVWGVGDIRRAVSSAMQTPMFSNHRDKSRDGRRRRLLEPVQVIEGSTACVATGHPV